MFAVDYTDPRLQPGATISRPRTPNSSPRMCEVVKCADGAVTVLDCQAETLSQITPFVLLRDWKLVRDAPSVPSVPEPTSL